VVNPSSPQVQSLDELGDWAIEATDIRKQFGSFEALKGVSFQVPRRSVFSILGPNGAGKTTLLRILTTITRPLSGSALIEGYNILSQVYEVRQKIGVVAQDNNFDRYLSIWHNLTLHAQMHGLDRSTYEPRIIDLLKRVDLYDRRDATPEVLSGGMKRRVSLIRALIHEPSVLFLDEPTTGLDPQARRDLWETIELFKQRATIILTTHYLDEADALSDHIMLVNHGQVVSSGTPTGLKQQVSLGDTLELVFKTTAFAEQSVLQLSQQLPNGFRIKHDGDERVLLTGGAQLRDVLPLIVSDQLLRAGWVEPDLETVFFQLAADHRDKDA
jgi:ABC-2 type transport system ATP-binding protein